MTILTLTKRAGLGFALALTAASSAMAADWNQGAGSVKDYGGSSGTAVPAPVPVPEYGSAQWYFRGDFGVGFGADPAVSHSGRPFGRTGVNTFDAPGPVTGPGQPFGYGDTGFGNSVAWNNNDETEFSPSYMFGVGVGRYVTSRFRIDLTGEYRGDHDADYSGTYSYTPHAADVCGNWCPDVTRRIDGTVTDRTRIRSGLFLLNGYWDLMQRGHLTPYIGAGIGFSLNENERSMSGSEQDCALGPPETCAAGTTYSGRVKSVTTSLAAALMAGVSYNIAANTKLDLNYRYLYVGGYDVNMNINSNIGTTTASSLKIGDQHEHQIRAGLRWDIN